MSKLQAVIFNKKHFNKDQAAKWLKEHSKSPIKEAHETKNYLRYRLEDPAPFNKFFVKDFDPPNGFIKGVFGYGYPI